MRPTIFIASAALVALTACGGGYGSPTLPDTNTNGGQTGDVAAQLDAPFTLSPGQWASVSGTGLRVGFVAVTADSRCPTNVQCVWQGDAAVSLRLSLNGEDNSALIHSAGGAVAGPNEAGVGVYTVGISDVQPQTVAGQTIAPAAYRVTLVARHK